MLEYFRDEVGILVVEKVLWFSARSRGGAGDVRGSTFWLVLVNECLETAVSGLVEQEVRGDQKQNLYAVAPGKMRDLAVEQLIANVRASERHCAGSKMISGEGGI